MARPASEAALTAVRDRLAALVRGSRQRTGNRLRAATTLTVNRENLSQLEAPIHWFMDNLGAFRILSFQPQADTGRTRSGDGVAAEEVWAALEAALGTRMEPHTFRFGHQACNRINVSLVLETGRKRILIQTVRPGNAMDHAFAARVLRTFGGLVLASVSFAEGAGRILGQLLRKPAFLVHLAGYAIRRLWQERHCYPAIASALLRRRLRLRTCAFIVHAFMSREELETPLGRERLAGCTFKLAVGDRLVSMCEMNATGLRESTYAKREQELPN